MTEDRRAADVVARLSASEVQALAVQAVALVFAEDESLADLAHREHVHGVIRGAAPTFSHALRALIKNARNHRAQQPVCFRPSA